MGDAALKEVHLPISGMTCAACSSRIEKGLNKLDGVQEASVNLALEKATIKYNPEVTSVAAFEEKIEDLGYAVVTEKAEFELLGMTCAACSGRIEKVLNKLPGVKHAVVNLALETGTVEYNPEQVSVQDMIKKVENLGYQAKVKTDNDQDIEGYREKEIEKQKGKFIFSLILSIPLFWSMVGHFEFTSFIYVPEMFMNPWVQLALAAQCNSS